MSNQRIVQGAQISLGSNAFVATANANAVNFAPAATTPKTTGQIPTLQPNTVWKCQVLDANMKADGGGESFDLELIQIAQGGAETIVARRRVTGVGNNKGESLNGRGFGTKFRIPDAAPATLQLRAVNRASGGGSLPVSATATIEQVVPDPRQTPYLTVLTN